MPVHPIFALILCGNLIEVATLISSDPNAIKARKSDYKNVSPLHWAVKKKQKKISKKLLDAGSDVNNKDDDGCTPLHYAAEEGDSDLTTLLIEHGANINSVDDFGETPAHVAAENGHKNVLEVLVTHRANMNAKSNTGNTPLDLAAAYGQYEAVKYMLEHTPIDTSTCDSQGYTPLHTTALRGHSSCAKILLEHSPQIVNSKTYGGWTPLHLACQSGDYNTVVNILQHKPTLEVNDEGDSALHKAANGNHDKIVEVMVQEHGWDQNIRNTKTGKTPLMLASQYGAIASIQKLLDLDCDPDLLDIVGKPALDYAIISEVLPAVHMLLATTTQGLKPCITKLARSIALPMSDEIKHFIKEKTKFSSDLFLAAFEESVKFANVEVLHLLVGRTRENDKMNLLNNDTEVKDELNHIMPFLITNSIYSDDFKACQIVRDLCQHLNYEIQNECKELAKERGIRSIIKIFDKDTSWDDEMKSNLKTEVRNHVGPLTDDSSILLDLIPKSVEFPYFNELQKIKEMLPGSMTNRTKLINYKDLINKLWVPTVHYQEECPDDCGQKTNCLCIREVLTLLRHLMEEISKKFSIFSGTEVIIVGSLKENTKISHLDEADCLLVLDSNKRFEEFLEFNEKEQEIKFIKYKPKNKELEPFRMENGQFNSKKYFMTFLTLMYTVLTSCGQQLPADLKLSMDPLVTTYEPCERCMSEEYLRPQCKRCRHKPGCNHENNCGCTEFTSPCMSWTKIGAAIHVKFSKYGLNLDIDLNPPNIRTRNIDQYNGHNWKKRQYLEKNKSVLVGWLEEWRKSLNMSEARNLPGSKRSVRLRLINRETVLAEQCLLFYRRTTLEGSKQWIYVIMKILKLVTQPSPKITSYQMKFAVDQALLNMTPTDEQIGECLRKVLQYNTLSGRFENRAHIKLAEMGLERVEVTDQGLNFIGKQTHRAQEDVAEIGLEMVEETGVEQTDRIQEKQAKMTDEEQGTEETNQCDECCIII